LEIAAPLVRQHRLWSRSSRLRGPGGWVGPDRGRDPDLLAWLGVGQRLAELVGVWEEATLPPLPPGDTRIL